MDSSRSHRGLGGVRLGAYINTFMANTNLTSICVLTTAESMVEFWTVEAFKCCGSVDVNSLFIALEIEIRGFLWNE